MSEYQKKNEYDYTIEAVASALKKLDDIENSSSNLEFLMGFDGYIDLLSNMVKNRSSISDFEIYDTMEEFGQQIIKIAGSSASIERVLKKRLAGGFAPNMARAIANMAPKSNVDLYAAMGFPEIDPLFQELPKNVNLHSIGNSGVTLAMEFSDGKVMSQDMGGIFELDYKTLISRIGGKDNLIAAFEKTNAIGAGHWSLFLNMNEYFEKFVEEILPNLSKPSEKLFFMDPADLNKRSKEDIREMLSLLKKIDNYIPVVLSLNDRETIDVANVLKDDGVAEVIKGNEKTYEKAGKNINSVIGLSNLIIHEPHFATFTNANSHYWVTEGYTPKPRFTVAAGDHFNSGILLSLLSGLPPQDSLVVANSATAIFVRTGISPSVGNLNKYMLNYFDYILNSITDFEF